MATKVRCAFIFVLFVLGSALCAYAQLRPEVTAKPKPKKPPAAKVTPKPAEKPEAKPEQPQKPPEPEPAQIVIETSPNAEVYLDDQFVGRANPQGRLVIGNPAPGERRLRVALAGKRDYEGKVAVVAGQTLEVAAALADLPGRILVRSLPGARIFLNDFSRGLVDTTGQLVIEPVAPGPYEVRISSPGKRDYRQNITVLVGQQTRVEGSPGDVGPAVAATFPVSYRTFWGAYKGHSPGLMTVDEAAVRFESDNRKYSFVLPFAEIEKIKPDRMVGYFEIWLKSGKKYTFVSFGGSRDAITRAINRAMGRY